MQKLFRAVCPVCLGFDRTDIHFMKQKCWDGTVPSYRWEAIIGEVPPKGEYICNTLAQSRRNYLLLQKYTVKLSCDTFSVSIIQTLATVHMSTVLDAKDEKKEVSRKYHGSISVV